MKIRASAMLLAGLLLAGGFGNPLLSFKGTAPTELTSFVQNTAQTVLPTPEYDKTFGATWQSIRIFRLVQPMDRPLKVYVNTQPSKLFRPHYTQYVTGGLDTWAKALDNRFTFTLTDNAKEADISVDWVESFPDRYTAGLATYRVGDADIRIKTVGVPDKDIQANIIHELGHALGIAGHSNDQNDIMVGMRRWRNNEANYHPKLSANDVKAIQRLYSSRWRKGEDLYVAVRNEHQVRPAAEVASGPRVESQTGSLTQDTRASVEAYMADVRYQVYKAWTSPTANKGKAVIVRFEVDRTGRLASCQVRQSSGSGQTDSAAVETIRSAVARMPLPQDYPLDRMSLEIALR